jgi:hypothetical protein
MQQIIPFSNEQIVWEACARLEVYEQSEAC